MLLELIYNDWPFETKIIIFFTFLVAMIIGLAFHEVSHAFCAYKCGDLTPKVAGRLTFNPLAHIDKFGFFSFLVLGFGWAKPVPINPFNFKKFKRDTFLVSVSGVLTNLAIAFVMMPFVGLVAMYGFELNFTLYQILFYLFSFIVQVNIVLMVFNLLPIYPLDGFNAIAAYLRYENKFVQFMKKYGSLILIGLLIVFDIVYAATDISILNYLCYYVSYPFTAFWSWVMGMPINSIGMLVLGV